MYGRGFTLIELLVVVAIIGLLASIGLASYGIVREKGRDARRIQDVRELQEALNAYTISENVFPISPTAVTLDGTDTVSTALLNTGVLNAIPRDPQFPITEYAYQSDTGGSTYTISFCLETDSIPNFAQGCGNTLTP